MVLAIFSHVVHPRPANQRHPLDCWPVRLPCALLLYFVFHTLGIALRDEGEGRSLWARKGIGDFFDSQFQRCVGGRDEQVPEVRLPSCLVCAFYPFASLCYVARCSRVYSCEERGESAPCFAEVAEHLYRVAHVLFG